MSSKETTFVKGAAILAIAGLICKILGGFYHIALANIITVDGMAYHGMAYPIYAFFLVTSGIDVAVSKLVSEKIALNDYRGAYRVFQTVLKILFFVGLICAGVLFALSVPYATISNMPDGYIVLQVIAPAVLFVSILNAYTGFFQGMQNMKPTAITQVVEQSGKILFGLLLASYFVSQGPVYGAMGAILGMTLSEFVALFVLIVIFNVNKRGIKEKMRMYPQTTRESGRYIAKRFSKIAVPVVITSSIFPLTLMLETVIIMNTLGEGAKTLFGTMNSGITSIINMPSVLFLAIGMSLMPAISGSITKNEKKQAREKAGMGLKLGLIIGLPCAIALFLMADQVINLLLPSLKENIPVAIMILRIESMSVFFIAILQTMSPVLQGYGRFRTPVKHLFFGAIGKLVIGYLLMRNPEINIAGAAMGTVICYAIAGIWDLIVVIKVSKMEFKFMDLIAKPLFSSAFLGAFLYFSYPLVSNLTGGKVATIIVMGVGAILYLLMTFIIGALNEEDMDFVPGGRKITSIMLKMGIWK